MVPPPGTRPTLAALFACLVVPATALEIRNYSEANNRRLKDFPGFVYGHAPYVNPTFSPGRFTVSASKFLGVGWPEDPYDWTRQMGLISPVHILYATHYPLNLNWKINFLGSDGAQHAYGLLSQTPLINSQGQQTDIMLVTLSEPVTAEGVKFFKVLNLATESSYVGRPIVACGSFVDTSTTMCDGFATLSNDPGFDTTRFGYFDYNRLSTNITDPEHRCNVRPGDSGGPIFIMQGNEPNIIGAFSAYDDLTPNDNVDGPIFRSYFSSIASYYDILDSMMDAKGYHLTRFYPEATTMTSATTPSGWLRQMKSGQVNIAVSNTGTAKAHNVAVKITFTNAPTSVSGTGWICEAESATVWNCRRGAVNGGASANLTATWNALPALASMQVTSKRSYDGGTDLTLVQTLSLLESYSSWILGAPDTGKYADPDTDGICNLLEYDFGGSPTTRSQRAAAGYLLLPQTGKSGNNLVITYPRRTDEAARGLTSLVQFSSSPGGPWSSSSPAGTVTTSGPFSPSATGFEKVSVSVPVTSPRQFVRVKVTLND